MHPIKLPHLSLSTSARAENNRTGNGTVRCGKKRKNLPKATTMQRKEDEIPREAKRGHVILLKDRTMFDESLSHVRSGNWNLRAPSSRKDQVVNYLRWVRIWNGYRGYRGRIVQRGVFSVYRPLGLGNWMRGIGMLSLDDKDGCRLGGFTFVCSLTLSHLTHWRTRRIKKKMILGPVSFLI